MRTSDWSSDVCSSDLNQMLARRQFNDKFGPSSLGLLSTNMPAMRFNDRTTDKESNAQTGFFCREKRIKKLWSICGWRSEEHTSELQSLMRISYAVFCLKTKNNNNTMRRTITVK